MLEYDVLVVGGGVAGLIASREAARHGLNVALYEEDKVIGRPERCAGLYSISGLKSIEIPITGRHVQNVIRGAIIYSPSGKSFEVKTSGPVAIVANREELDRVLAEQALREGVVINSGTRVIRARRVGDCVQASLESGESIRCRVLIDAEGHSGFLARQLFAEYRSRDWIPIIQFLVHRHGMDKDKVYVWIKPYLRDFFGYLVPIDEERGKVGVAAYYNTLQKAFRFLSDTFPKARVLGYSSSSVYSGPPLAVGLSGNVLLVGDVAGQAKATTGGGVVIGGMCASIAGRHAYKLIEHKDTGFYRRNVGHIYAQLRMIYYINRTLKRMSDASIDKLISSIAESGYAVKLSSAGDMDFQFSGLLRSVIRHPPALFLYRYLSSVVGDILSKMASAR